jgi:hypothetical protein
MRLHPMMQSTRSGLTRSSSLRGRETARISHLPDLLRLSEACCIISCLYVTVMPMISSRGKAATQKQPVAKQQHGKKELVAQPSMNLMPFSTDDTAWSSSYISLLLTLALVFRGAADLISRVFKPCLPSLSLDGAARLARLEAMVSEQSRSLELAQRASDKSRLRYDLYSSGGLQANSLKTKTTTDLILQQQRSSPQFEHCSLHKQSRQRL